MAESFPHEVYDIPHPSRKHTISDISDLVSYPKRRNHKVTEKEARHIQTTNNSGNIQIEDQPTTNKYDKVEAYFTTMKNCPEDINNAEYMNIAHEKIQTYKTMDKNQDTQINLSDFVPEPKSLSQVLRLSQLSEKNGAYPLRKKS